VLIAEGFFVRAWDEKAGDYRYWHAAYAPATDNRQTIN
jgi:hypothetical protein